MKTAATVVLFCFRASWTIWFYRDARIFADTDGMSRAFIRSMPLGVSVVHTIEQIIVIHCNTCLTLSANDERVRSIRFDFRYEFVWRSHGYRHPSRHSCKEVLYNFTGNLLCIVLETAQLTSTTTITQSEPWNISDMSKSSASRDWSRSIATTLLRRAARQRK